MMLHVSILFDVEQLACKLCWYKVGCEHRQLGLLMIHDYGDADGVPAESAHHKAGL